MLAGAAHDGCLAPLSGFIPPVHRAESAASIGGLRLALGTAAYDHEWARGAAMSYDDVVTFALRELDRLVAAETEGTT